jgi:hypothetical protein
MIGFRRTFLVVASISGAILACSGGSGSSAGLGGGAADATAFFEDFCTTFGPCCAQVNKPTDGATCKQLYGALTNSQDYDPAKGQACLNDVHARQSAPDFCTNPTGNSASCKGVFKSGGSSNGTKAPGEACTSDSDCASSNEGDVRCATSYGSGGTSTKACQVTIEGGREGDKPCLGTKDGNVTIYESSYTSGDAGPPALQPRGYICDVANGAYCDAKAGACAKMQDVGGPCEGYSQYQCVKAAYCDYATKKCVARVGAGGDCSKTPQACAEGTRCDSATRKCVARLADGADCKSGEECVSKACQNGKCGASSSSGNGDATMKLLCGAGTK